MGRGSIGLLDRGLGVSIKWQRGLQISGHAAVADSIRMQAVGHLAPPLWFHGKVALGGSDDTTRNPSPPGMAQGRVTKTANFSRFAVNGAAMLAGFYHRSVLRCGCLAERNSGVEGILAVAQAMGKKSFELSRIGYPGQRAVRDPNLWNAAPSVRTLILR